MSAVGGLHAVIDDDAAIDGKAGILGEPDARPDADRHDDQRRRNDAAVVELDPLDLAVADDRFGVGLGDDLDAALFDRALQQVAGGRIELALHQRRHHVQYGDVHAARCKAGGGLEAEQAAADDDRLVARLGGEQHRLHVVEIAVGHARPAGPCREPGMMNGTEPVAITSLS